MMSEICKNCVHFMLGDIEEGNEDGKIGACERFPPTNSLHHEVHEDDYCGEFELDWGDVITRRIIALQKRSPSEMSPRLMMQLIALLDVGKDDEDLGT